MRTILLVILVCAPVSRAGTLFVDESASPGGDGSQWATAFQDLQDALDAARLDASIAEIDVAGGSYRPDRGTLGNAMSFELVDGVAVLGGFPKGGGTPVERDPAAHETVLTGDLLGDDQPPDQFGFLRGNADNSLHVVSAINCGRSTVLDGFTIRGGHAHVGAIADQSGGNVHIAGGGPAVRNCVIERARAAWDGGGLAAIDSEALVESCTFRENVADALGGGAAMAGTNGAEVRDCLFERNIGGSGCGLYCGPLHPFQGNGNATTIVNSQFVENNAVIGATAGGGVLLSRGDNVVAGCRFLGNRANGGGGVYVRAGYARIERCAFFGNEGDGDGGGAIYVEDFSASVPVFGADIESCLVAGNNGALLAVNTLVNLTNCTVAHNGFPDRPIFLTWPAMFSQDAVITLRNTIVWGNPDLDIFGGVRDFLAGDLAYDVFDSIVQGWDGTLSGEALDVDPVFADTSGLDGDKFAAADNNYRLRLASPAIDAGSNGSLAPGALLDVEGGTRVRDGDDDGSLVVDMGAYERCFVDVNVDGRASNADAVALVGGLVGPNTASLIGDLDGDGDTDLGDFAILQRRLVTGCD